MTTTIDGTNVSTFAEGVTCTALNGGQLGGRRNLVMNGEMKVAQRTTSSAGLGADAMTRVLDRWGLVTNTGDSATAGRVTMAQVADGPAGFANCLKLTTTTADTSIAAGEVLLIQQGFEGQDLQQIYKGVSGAKQVTVSFYVKGNANATYTCELFDRDNGRTIGQAFAVTTAWNRIELTFAADEDDGSSPFDDDTAVSLHIQIFLHGGTTFSGGTFVNNTWADQANNTRMAESHTSILDSTDRTFFLTGVQMELGDTATEFEHRSYGEELALCQRYLPSVKGQGRLGNGNFSSTSRAYITVSFGVDARVRPTGISYGTIGNYNLGEDGIVAPVALSALAMTLGNINGARLTCDVATTPFTANRVAGLDGANSSANILFDGCEI